MKKAHQDRGALLRIPLPDGGFAWVRERPPNPKVKKHLEWMRKFYPEVLGLRKAGKMPPAPPDGGKNGADGSAKS